MKDYTIRESEKSQYVIGFWKNDDGTMSVKFADGTVFSKIAYSEENLKKIAEMQEAQAKVGLQRYPEFDKAKKSSKIKTILSGSVTGIMYAFGAGSMFIPAMQSMDIATAAPIALGVGTITAVGTIVSAHKLRKESARVTELDKIKYRDEHRKDLEKSRDYHNAYAGMPAEKARYFTKKKQPYSILNIDSFTQDDLETIIRNMETEAATDFTYVAEDAEGKTK